MTTPHTLNIAKIPTGKGDADFQSVYDEIASKLKKFPDYDHKQGYAPVLCRLAWHTSGTYRRSDNTGGSYIGSMIYAPELSDPENNGLEVARDFLEEIAEKNPWISRGDLWTLGGVCAVQQTGGPTIPWRAGRVNCDKNPDVPPNGRIPDPGEGPKYVREIFAEKGFSDQETVALIGAHCLGRCHYKFTQYDGPWTDDPEKFTNEFYTELLNKWHVKQWKGRKQYAADDDEDQMMLPTDMALKEDTGFLKYVKDYAEDEKLFFKDFSAAFAKLLELGITYSDDMKPMELNRLE